ncbi:MAG: hypothetical protein WCG27_07325, partial [Pseudomonadota bacterium]
EISGLIAEYKTTLQLIQKEVEDNSRSYYLESAKEDNMQAKVLKKLMTIKLDLEREYDEVEKTGPGQNNTTLGRFVLAGIKTEQEYIQNLITKYKNLDVETLKKYDAVLDGKETQFNPYPVLAIKPCQDEGKYGSYNTMRELMKFWWTSDDWNAIPELLKYPDRYAAQYHVYTHDYTSADYKTFNIRPDPVLLIDAEAQSKLIPQAIRWADWQDLGDIELCYTAYGMTRSVRFNNHKSSLFSQFTIYGNFKSKSGEVFDFLNKAIDTRNTLLKTFDRFDPEKLEVVQELNPENVLKGAQWGPPWNNLANNSFDQNYLWPLMNQQLDWQQGWTNYPAPIYHKYFKFLFWHSADQTGTKKAGNSLEFLEIDDSKETLPALILKAPNNIAGTEIQRIEKKFAQQVSEKLEEKNTAKAMAMAQTLRERKQNPEHLSGLYEKLDLTAFLIRTYAYLALNNSYRDDNAFHWLLNPAVGLWDSGGLAHRIAQQSASKDGEQSDTFKTLEKMLDALEKCFIKKLDFTKRNPTSEHYKTYFMTEFLKAFEQKRDKGKLRGINWANTISGPISPSCLEE